MTTNEIEFTPAFESRSGRLQIAQGHYKGRYVVTLWTCFPKTYDFAGEVKEFWRFCANMVPASQASLLLGFNTEPSPYDDGALFPVLAGDTEAQRFLDSPAFRATYKEE